MTIATIKLTADAILAKLRAAHAADPNPDDVLGLSQNQRYALHERRHQRDSVISAIVNTVSLLEKPTARLAECERVRPIMIGAQAEIEKQSAEAPDWRTLPTGHERDREWGRQQTLQASLNALACGVEYFGGVPAVPKVLADLLGGTSVDQEGRQIPSWFGSLPSINRQIEEATERIATLQMELAGYLKSAEALLGETGQ